MDKLLLTRLKQLGFNSLTGGIALDALSKALVKDETILKIIEGAHMNTIGAVIATDLRIFYIGVNRHKKAVLEQVRYEDILSIDIGSQVLISVEMYIITKNSKKLSFKGCDITESSQFTELIRMLTFNNKQSA